MYEMPWGFMGGFPVKTRVYKRDCFRCHRSFQTFIPEMVYCNATCKRLFVYEKAKGIKKEFKSKPCENCSSEMKDNQKQRFCCRQCSLLFYREEERKKNILEANARAAPEEKKPNPALRNFSHTQEHTRLYDDFHIRRQIKGISRDLI